MGVWETAPTPITRLHVLQRRACLWSADALYVCVPRALRRAVTATSLCRKRQRHQISLVAHTLVLAKGKGALCCVACAGVGDAA